MSERDDELRKIARERMKDMPGETAAGRIDPDSLPEDQRDELAHRSPHAEPADADSEDS
jgi:hypothetical protein